MRRKSRLLTSLLQVLQRCYKVASSHTRETQSSGAQVKDFIFETWITSSVGAIVGRAPLVRITTESIYKYLSYDRCAQRSRRLVPPFGARLHRRDEDRVGAAEGYF